MRQIAKIGLLHVTLVLFLSDFMTPQTATTAFAAGTESLQSPIEASTLMRTVLNWLECEECIEGELKAVIRLNHIAVPPLSIALREGPSPSSLEIYKRELMVSYTRMANSPSSNDTKGLVMTRDGYIALHLRNYVTLYQIRALTALKMIGGTAAETALEDALQVSLPNEIAIKIQDALTSRELKHSRTK